MKEKVLRFLALFTSTGTLLCCALPAALVTLAGAAAISTYLNLFPWVIPLSRHTGWIFLIAGILILASAVFTLRPRSRLACAVTGGKGCEEAGTFSKWVFWFAVIIYAVGAFMTYGIVPLLKWMEG
jgi:mercuric ion transport protein